MGSRARDRLHKDGRCSLYRCDTDRSPRRRRDKRRGSPNPDRPRRGPIIRRASGVWRRSKPSVFERLAERFVASAAAVFPEVAESHADLLLIAALHGHEERVGLAGGILLSIEKLVPIAPNSRLGSIFSVRAGRRRSRWKHFRNLFCRLGQISGARLGLCHVGLALGIGLDAAEILCLPLHQGLTVLEDRLLVL